MKQWKTILSVVLVFILGALAGGLAVHSIYQHRMGGDVPRRSGEFIVQRLNRKLHLDTNQLEQLRGIVKETQSEMRTVRNKIRPEIEEVLSRSQARIRALLTPEQADTYDRLIAERKKKRDNDENGR